MATTTTLGPDDYRGPQGKRYTDPAMFGFVCLPILRVLWGLPWDELALDVVALISPTYIRVIAPNHMETTDTIPGRVTVYLDDDDRTITEITISSRVGLRSAESGHGIKIALSKRKKLGNCEECGRALVPQVGMDVWGAGNWDVATKRCEFCKSTDYFTRVQRAQEAYHMGKYPDEIVKHLDEHPFPNGHKGE